MMPNPAPSPCLFVNPDNVERVRQTLNLNVAVVARPDPFMAEADVQHLIVETERGVHVGCYLCRHNDIPFLIIYGRFERVRGTSADIDFELTQEVVSFLGISTLIGTFVVGSIREDDAAGTVYVPHDFIGFGNYNLTRNRTNGFRNVDMFMPFCPNLRRALVTAAEASGHPHQPQGVYACFLGYPRIETLAELEFYQQAGCDIVGQTLDAEATLAREAGCHYAALAVTIDDHAMRTRFLNNETSVAGEIDRLIEIGRERTWDIFLGALPHLDKAAQPCSCEEQGRHVKRRSKYFYYRPDYLGSGPINL